MRRGGTLQPSIMVRVYIGRSIRSSGSVSEMGYLMCCEIGDGVLENGRFVVGVGPV